MHGIDNETDILGSLEIAEKREATTDYEMLTEKRVANKTIRHRRKCR